MVFSKQPSFLPNNTEIRTTGTMYHHKQAKQSWMSLNMAKRICVISTNVGAPKLSTPTIFPKSNVERHHGSPSYPHPTAHQPNYLWLYSSRKQVSWIRKRDPDRHLRATNPAYCKHITSAHEVAIKVHNFTNLTGRCRS